MKIYSFIKKITKIWLKNLWNSSSNLVNLEYKIYNKQVTKEEFKEFIKKYKFDKNKFPKKIVKNLNTFNTENSIWDNL